MYSEWNPKDNYNMLAGIFVDQGPSKENIPTSPFEDIHPSHTNQTNLMHSTRSIICSSNQARMSCSHKYRATATHKTI
jgi:hypothetical protein